MTTAVVEPGFDAGGERARTRGLRIFQIISAAQFVSLTGSGLTRFAMGVWIYQQSGSATLFALTEFFGIVPYVLASPLAGAAVDRWNRRLLLVLGDAGAALGTLMLALLLWRGNLAMWQVYLATALGAVCGAFQGPAFSATVPLLVARRDLAKASSLAQTVTGVAQLIAPALAGLLVVGIGIHGVLLVDFLTFLVAIVTMLLVEVPDPPRTEARGRRSLLADAGAGWRYLTERPGLLALILLFGVTNFFMGSVLALSTPLILSSFRPAALGSVMTIAGLGLLAGSLTLGAILGTGRRTLRVLAFTALGGLCIAAGGTRPSLPLIAAAAFAFFFATQVMSGGFRLVIRCKVLPEFQGRVFAMSSLVVNATLPLAYLVVGPLADKLFEPALRPGGALAGSLGLLLGTGPGRGIGLMFVVMGLSTVAAVGLGLCFPRLRRLDLELEDALPDNLPAQTLRAEPPAPAPQPVTPGEPAVARGLPALALGLLALLVACGVGALRLESRTPPALPQGAPPEAFSAQRAFAHLERVARVPHPLGSAAHDDVRAYLLAALRELGVEPRVEEAELRVPQGGGLTIARPRNVVAGLPGRQSARTVLLVAHYDSAPHAPGAGDDGLGVAAILETVRALRSRPALRHDVLVLLSDGEELGSLGAQAFVQAHPELARDGVVLNLEARGTRGPALMFETSGPNAGLVRTLAAARPGVLATSFYELGYRFVSNRTDLTVFGDAGFTGLTFAPIDGPVDYHSAQDRAERIDLGSLQQLGEHALELATRLADEPPDAPDKGSAVYFSLAGLRLCAYPRGWALLLALVAALGCSLVLLLGVRRGRLVPAALALGAGALVAGAACAAAAVAFFWWVLQALRVEDVMVTWSDAYRLPAYAGAFALLALAAVLGLFAALGPSVRPREALGGALAVWTALGLMFAAWQPGTSHAFLWPSVFGVVALGLGHAAPAPLAARLELLLLSIPGLAALVLWVPLSFWLLLGLSLVQSWMLAGLLALALGLLAPLAAGLGPRLGRGVAGAALAASLVVLAGAAARSAYDTAHRRPDSLFYALDASRSAAVWLSTDPSPDAWTARYLGAGKGEQQPLFFPGSQHAFLSAPAPVLALRAPVVDVLGDTQRDGRRELHLRVRSQRGAALLQVALPRGPLRACRLDGQAVALGKEDAKPLVLRSWAAGPAGLELALELQPGAPFELGIVDQSLGLPELAPLGLPERPNDTMPAHFGLGVSDVTLVGTTYALEAAR